jgi:LmbE family N-acetylglucosaminyl deacetylase
MNALRPPWICLKQWLRGEMMTSVVDPNIIFQGTILIVAPHMDDEALACGGIIARLSEKERIHIVYATDGMKSPSPIVPGRDSISPDLGKVREMESIAAMKYLGLPEKNMCFLGLPEANLRKNVVALANQLMEYIRLINPDFIFIPFRYDRHPDHLAINQVLTAEREKCRIRAQLIEFFVYYRWRLLPKGDVRKYIKPECLIEVDISDVSQKKRTALDYFKSQTTEYYSWQTRPILTSKLLDEECHNPEFFLLCNPSLPGTAVFTRAILWIRVAHRLEPFLQKSKYLIGAILKRVSQKDAQHAR